MPTDYQALHEGRDLEGELKRSVAFQADMYGEPSHFIVELLQNAEDALGKRPDGWQGDRTVSFDVKESSVEVAHFGRPFDEDDVEGIVITLDSTKTDDLNAIGKFGVGFKSVFNITDRPEIHSGDENFAIEDFIEPVGIDPIPDRDPELTTFRLPLNRRGRDGRQDIVKKMSDLEPRTLLFLRHIGGIAWHEADGTKGKLYRRTEWSNDKVRKVNLTCENGIGVVESTECWILFSRPVFHEGKSAGYVEIAFLLSEQDAGDIQPLDESPLTVFFQTIVPTNLGFLVQGPYRTTPNRENVPPADNWNRKLMDETAMLIPEVLHWLKDYRLLNAQTLSGFPISGFYEEHEHYGPLFDATKAALESQALLPCADGSYHQAGKTRLGDSEPIRRLINPRQLADISGHAGQLFWIHGSITDARFQTLRRYIRDDLGVTDVTPEALIPLLRNGRAFLESQPDEWIRQLYEFFGGQPSLHDRLGDVPLLRLEDGRHVSMQGEISVFLPGKTTSQSPTVRGTVCNTDTALGFLTQLGLRERDPVDDVIENVLPKYSTEDPDVANYDDDIRLISQAYADVAVSRKADFIEKLYDVKFVMTVDAGDRSRQLSQPNEVWLATDEQKSLFSGVAGVRIADDTHESLLNQDFQELMMECDATLSDDMTSIVIEHILPKYRGTGGNSVDAITYTRDIKRILAAYETASNQQQLRLRNSLTTTPFVRAVDSGSGTKSWRGPRSVYLATAQLRELFAGVEGVLMVDFNQNCLRGEGIGDLLVACGSARSLASEPVANTYTPDELSSVRRNAGLAAASWSEQIRNSTLKGVDNLLQSLSQLSPADQHQKAVLLWRALSDVAKHSGYSAFRAEYKWGYSYESKTAFLDTEVVKLLNRSAWVPDPNGELQTPDLVYFDTLNDVHGWEEESILESVIRFKPPAVQELARETGIEEEALDLMQKENLTADDLRDLLELRTRREQEPEQTTDDDGAPISTPPVKTSGGLNGDGPHPPYSGGGTQGGGNSGGSSTPSGAGAGTSAHTPGGGTWEFHSYVGVHPNEHEADDPDSPEHAARMELEELAIQFIQQQEPDWQRTETNNPGFDLYQVDSEGIVVRWCEVKSMSGAFDSRPATMTRRQFQEAQERGQAYWLYVVENTGTDAANIVPIQDPAGQARTFTFDKGWRDISETEG